MILRRLFLQGVSAGYATAVGSPMCMWAQSSAGRRLGNPIVVGRGLCDPQVRVYDHHVFLYATHDRSPDNKTYVMDNWWVWHSEDLVHWDHVSTLLPEQTYWRKPWSACWATDAMRRNGRRGPVEIGVVESDSPRGPWRDPLGKPLIAKGSTPTLARDPGILQEKDGTSYIVFGCWNYYIARLNEDMVSLAETPRMIEVHPKMGPYGPGKLDDKPFLHKRNGIYYLSWGCYYAVSDSVYGPYTYRDTIIHPDSTVPAFRRHLTMDRHGSFFELYGQWGKRRHGIRNSSRSTTATCAARKWEGKRHRMWWWSA